VYDAAKAMIHNRLGIPIDQMLFAATHTHSGTSAEKQGSQRRGWQKPSQKPQFKFYL